jgi:hypothetical protein
LPRKPKSVQAPPCTLTHDQVGVVRNLR